LLFSVCYFFVKQLFLDFSVDIFTLLDYRQRTKEWK